MFKIDNNFVAKKANIKEIDIINVADNITRFLATIFPFFSAEFDNNGSLAEEIDDRTKKNAELAVSLCTIKHTASGAEPGRTIVIKEDDIDPFFFSSVKIEKYLKTLYEEKAKISMYFGTHFFNNKITYFDEKKAKEKGFTDEQIRRKKFYNRLSTRNTFGIYTIASDFDDISVQEMNEELERFNSINLNPSIVVSSGHGFHLYWLLKEPSYSYNNRHNLFYVFNKAIERKGFKNDAKVCDTARILRLPYTFNCKNKDDILEVEMLYCDESIKYTEEEILSALDKIPDELIEIDENEFKNVKFVEIDNNSNSNNDNNDNTNNINNTDININADIKNKDIKIKDNIRLLSEEVLEKEFVEVYKDFPALFNMPSAIKQVLMGFQAHLANIQLMFLILYFKKEGFTKEFIIKIIDIMKIQDRYNYAWNIDLVPEINRFYYSDYSALAVWKEYLKGFGFVDFCLQDKSVIKINNNIFTCFKNISTDTAVVYFKMLLENNYNNKFYFNLDDYKLFNLSKRRLQPHFQKLVDIHVFDKKRSAKKKSENYDFIFSKFANENEGFTKFNAYVLQDIINKFNNKELTATQVCILIYLKYMCFNSKNTCYPSQETVAQIFGLTQSTVSRAFKTILDLKFVTREEVKETNFKFYYKYNIHF